LKGGADGSEGCTKGSSKRYRREGQRGENRRGEISGRPTIYWEKVLERLCRYGVTPKGEEKTDTETRKKLQRKGPGGKTNIAAATPSEKRGKNKGNLKSFQVRPRTKGHKREVTPST